jgi:type II secretory pathway pseudopilin PulG
MNFKLKLLQHLFKDESQGLTIIEGLLAIVIVTILIMGIGPVLAFAAATRINARRVELASQAATAYLDGVRSGSIALPPIEAPRQNPSQQLGQVDAPASDSLTCNTAYAYCTQPSTAKYQVYCVDSNWNGKCTTDREDRQDFIVQAFGVGPIAANNTNLLGVRVYRADSFGAGLILKTKGNDNAKTSVLAGGSGNRVAPVVEMTTELPVQ